MEDTTPGCQPCRPAWFEVRRDAALLLILLSLATAVRAWLITHTEVTARDGIGFIRYAWQLERHPWPAVLKENPHPPAYPLAVLAVSTPLRHWLPADDRAAMQLSAQLANALAGVLLVVPMFYLGRGLFDRRVGFWAAALFQCLPVSGRILSDALSEGVYLLVVTTGLVFALRAFRTSSALCFGLCGVCAGLAYLTRPEGVLLLGAAGLVLAACQAKAAWRRPWGRALACGVSLAIAAVAVGAPYALVIHRFTNKETGRNLLRTAADRPGEGPSGVTAGGPGAPLLASTLGVYSHEKRRALWGLGALGGEVLKGYHYAAVVPAVLGLYWFRNRFRQPGAAVLLALCGLYTVVLWRVAFVAGYVAERHSLVFVLCGLYWAVAAVFAAGDWLAGRLGRVAAGGAYAVVMLAALALTALPKTLEPLHTNRAGFHAAGLWLAQHAGPADVIVDPFDWAGYYAGQVLRDADGRPSQPGSQPGHYVVLGGTDNEHRRLPLIPVAETIASAGTVVYQWPEQPVRFKAEKVVVYYVPPSPH
jgi:hypothetical protein